MNRAQLVRLLMDAQRFRAREMGDDLFGDPAWDILLDIYQAELTARPLSASSVGRLASIAPTTALRWMSLLEDRGLICREIDKGDRRRTLMLLTDLGRVGVEKSLDYILGSLASARASSTAIDR